MRQMLSYYAARARKLAEDVYPDLLGALYRCRERCLKNSPQLSLKI